MLCRRQYTKLVVAICAHQIQSESYGGNRSVSIEVINVEHFSATYYKTSLSSSHICTRHAVFHSFLSDNNKQDASKIDAHINQIIDLLGEYIYLGSGVSTIWDNTDGCAEHYRFDTELYLFSVLS